MRIANEGFWGMIGAKGIVYPERGQRPEVVKIPEFDGGHLITVVPTRVEATYRLGEGRRRIPTSVTVIGRPVREGRLSERGEVSYTWDDPSIALSDLPDWVRRWVERNQSPTAD